MFLMKQSVPLMVLEVGEAKQVVSVMFLKKFLMESSMFPLEKTRTL